jgi:hypothetical protein
MISRPPGLNAQVLRRVHSPNTSPRARPVQKRSEMTERPSSPVCKERGGSGPGGRRPTQPCCCGAGEVCLDACSRLPLCPDCTVLIRRTILKNVLTQLFMSRVVSTYICKTGQKRRLMASQHGFGGPPWRACASPSGVYAGDGRWHAHWGGHGLIWPKIGVQVHV